MRKKQVQRRGLGNSQVQRTEVEEEPTKVIEKEQQQGKSCPGSREREVFHGGRDPLLEHDPAISRQMSTGT